MNGEEADASIRYGNRSASRGVKSGRDAVRCPPWRTRPMRMMAAWIVLGLAVAAAPGAAPGKWWIDEPVRFLQTNLSETDSTVDPKALVAAVADFRANTFLLNMGGIVAQYPTKVPFHYASAFLPAGRDLFGDVLRERARAWHPRRRPVRPEQDAEGRRTTRTRNGSSSARTASRRSTTACTRRASTATTTASTR